MLQVADLARLRGQLARADFERRFPHPWLLRELGEHERSALFLTVASALHRDETTSLPLGSALRVLHDEPERWVLHPLAKSGANPWSDRILVGRASNNDVVIHDERVSKVHAYLQCGAGGAWRVHDARSANGTRVDGASVSPGDEGCAILAGQVVAFGAVPCRLVVSGALWDALGERPV